MIINTELKTAENSANLSKHLDKDRNGKLCISFTAKE